MNDMFDCLNTDSWAPCFCLWLSAGLLTVAQHLPRICCQSLVIRAHWQHIMWPYGLLTKPTFLQKGGKGRRPSHMDKKDVTLWQAEGFSRSTWTGNRKQKIFCYWFRNMKIIQRACRQTLGFNLLLFLTNRGLFPFLSLLLQGEMGAICDRGACWEKQIVRREWMKDKWRECEKGKGRNDRGWAGGGWEGEMEERKEKENCEEKRTKKEKSRGKLKKMQMRMDQEKWRRRVKS